MRVSSVLIATPVASVWPYPLLVDSQIRPTADRGVGTGRTSRAALRLGSFGHASMLMRWLVIEEQIMFYNSVAFLMIHRMPDGS